MSNLAKRISQFMHENKSLVIFAALAIVLIVVVLFVRATIIGYSTYNRMQDLNYSLDDYAESVSDLKTKLLGCEANLSSVSIFNEKLLMQADNASQSFYICRNDLDSTKTNLTQCQDISKSIIEELNMDIETKSSRLQELTDENDQYQDEIGTLKAQYDILAKNTANNLCCKAKVDNPAVKFYRVEGNRVLCLEEGELRISC